MMHKTVFISELSEKLSFLSVQEREERLHFYAEMIDDRMEEGLSEEEAVAAVGSAEEIARQIVADTPLSKIATERIKPKRKLKGWEIVLLALGSPIWLSLGIAAVAVVFSVYVSLWSVIISLWAVFGSLIACSFGGLAGGIAFICTGYVPSGIATVGGSLVCAGLAIFMFYGCKAATDGTIALTKKLALAIKNCFIRKEVA